MVNDVILNKIASIERCVKRIVVINSPIIPHFSVSLILFI